MPVEDVLDHRPRHGGHGPHRAGRRQHGRHRGDRRHPHRDPARSSPASRCSARSSTRVARATTSAASCAASSARRSSAGRCSASRARSRRTRSSRPRCTSWKEEGGRHTPFFNGYRPQFYFRTTDVTGVAKLPEGTEMVMPGDNIQMEIELIQPIAMDAGLRFAIREGGRTVGRAWSPKHQVAPGGRSPGAERSQIRPMEAGPGPRGSPSTRKRHERHRPDRTWQPPSRTRSASA